MSDQEKPYWEGYPWWGELDGEAQVNKWREQGYFPDDEPIPGADFVGVIHDVNHTEAPEGTATHQTYGDQAHDTDGNSLAGQPISYEVIEEE